MRLKSGRELQEWGNTWGITGDGDVSYGYDSLVGAYANESDSNGNDVTNGLHADDAIELADMMIQRWQAFRAKYEHVVSEGIIDIITDDDVRLNQGTGE